METQEGSIETHKTSIFAFGFSPQAVEAPKFNLTI